MSHWWCCCNGCCYVEDTFCRDDTGEAGEQDPFGGPFVPPVQGRLGDLWEVVSGTWYINLGYCGNCHESCTYCSDYTCMMQVVLSGITAGDESCEDCTDLNNTYHLLAQGSCLWRTTLDSSICDVEQVDLRLTTINYEVAPGEYETHYVLTVTAGDSTWQVDLGANQPACASFNGVSLAPLSSSDLCNNLSSACSVSSVTVNEVGYNYECGQCENTNPACTIRLRVNGIVAIEEGCEDCTKLNRSHDLTYQGSCLWKKYLPATVCGISTIDLELSGQTLTATIGDATWTADVGSDPSCIEFDNVSLTPATSGTVFDNSSSTCAATTVVTDDLDCWHSSNAYTQLGGEPDHKVLKCTMEYPGCDHAVDGDAAATITMVLNGIVSGDGSCGNCGELNDSFELSYQGGSLWRYSLSAAVCGVSQIDLQLSKIGSNYTLTATAGDSTWTADLGTDKPSMVNFSGVSLAPDESSDSCDNSSSTCTISGGNFGVYFRVDGYSYITQTWRAIVDYVDASNYWIVEIEMGNWNNDPAIGAMRIIRRSGGSETVIQEIDPVPVSGGPDLVSQTLYICLRDNILAARMYYPTGFTDYYPPYTDINALLTSPATSRYVALGTGDWPGPHAVHFNDFCLLKPTDDCALCTSMCANCKDYVMPYCWAITFSNMAAADCDSVECYERTIYLKTTGLNPCILSWVDECGILGCGGLQLFILYSEETGTYKIQVWITESEGTAIWEKDYGSNPIDCPAVSGDSLSLIQSGGNGITGDCVLSAATLSEDCPTDLTDEYRVGCCKDGHPAPQEVMVTFDGWEGCEDSDIPCSTQLNTSFVLTLADASSYCHGYWSIFPSDYYICSTHWWDGKFLRWIIASISEEGLLLIYIDGHPILGSGFYGTIFSVQVPENGVCDEWSDLDVPYNSTYGTAGDICDRTNVTCKITSL